MKEYLEIRHFGPIDHIVLEDIKPFTVFIGESGSGKSTIMKVLAIVRWIYKMVNIRSYLKDYSGLRKSPFRFSFPTYLKMDGLDGYLYPDSFIWYKRGKCEMEYSHSKFKLISQNIPQNELNLEKISFISEKRNLIPDAMDHNLSITKKAFYLNEVWNDYILATTAISELNMPFINVRFQAIKTKQGSKHFIKPLEGDGFAVELKSASSGIQSSTPIALITEYFSRHYNLVKAVNKSIFSYLSEFEDISMFNSSLSLNSFPNKRINLFIEEPELSLYPDNQVKLLDFLVDRAFNIIDRNYDMTMTMSTHSPFMVNYLNVLMHREKGGLNKNNIVVYRVFEGGIQNLMLYSEGGIIEGIDARDLSETMSDIYREYKELR